MPAWAWILLIALSWPAAIVLLGRRLRRQSENLLAPDRDYSDPDHPAERTYPPPYSRGGRW